MKGKKYFLQIFLSITIFFCASQVIAQDLEYAKSIVRNLTAPEFHGRGYVNDGDRKAAKYIANEFKTFGLRSYGRDYYQYFNIPVNTFPGINQLKINGKLLVPGVDYLVNPCSNGYDGQAQSIYLQKPELLDFRKLLYQVKEIPGKFVIADVESLEGQNLKQEALSNLQQLSKSDSKCEGIIVLTTQKLTWSLANVACEKPFLIVRKNAFIDKISDVSLNLDQKFYSDYRTQNVIGYIEGEHDDSLLVFTAHYDHLGRMGKNTYFPGANDNASGVALMLNLARHYASPNEKPPYDIAFIAFAAEEAGLLGSQYFVQNPFFPLNKIKFLINLDLSGTGDDGITVVNGAIYESKFDLLTNLNREYTLLNSVNARGEACNSDHCYFHLAHVPSFFIYTLGGIEAYHDIYDRFQTLPFTEYNDYFKLLVLFTDQMLNAVPSN